MNNDTALKEYYVNLQKMYNKVVNMLTAINQSLTTSASEINVNIADTDDGTSTVRIPSYLYLESKLENLSNNMDVLFNLPEDGEAWFSKDDTMIKLNIVRSNTAPVTPNIDIREQYAPFASLTDNNILKDMVSPKTYLKLHVDNLPENVSEMIMKKVVIHDLSVFNSIISNSTDSKISYSDLHSLLYTLKKGIDYDEYDSIIDLPIKKDYYTSNFKIVEVTSQTVVKLDTLMYYNEEDNAISYTLKVGDYLCLGNDMVVYKVTGIDTNNYYVTLEPYIGNTELQRFDENSLMVFKIYQENYNDYHYVQVPLEENPYIIIFLGTIWNGVRSTFSNGYVVDLYNISMKDSYGNDINDSNGNPYNYLTYYNEYCTNLGDLILGMSKCAYSQITNFTPDTLNTLFNGIDTKDLVSKSFNVDGILKVVAINKHLTDDVTTDDIINLHKQKNEVTAKLQTCQTNIDQVYSTLLTTDFSQNVTVTQASLQEKIQGYYTERTELQKQMNAIVDNINVKSDALNSPDTKTKYRIRGVTNTSIIDNYLSQFGNVEIIGIDIEYKYTSTNKDTATLTTINGATFTDWNKQYSIDKERKLSFSNNGYGIVFESYADTINTIKWNQIDIPIKDGEDVIIRIRYKYSVGQPFITLYTPWSDEYTMVFPEEFKENVELSTILETNSKDTISATFNKTLIDEGYTEHIQNKVLSNEQTFFHMPENIYSGFNTSENNLISLKDKLQEMSNTIETYRQYIEGLSNTAMEVYLNYDDNSVLLSPNSINKINIYNTDHITDMFIKKEMNIVIKNTGTSRLNLYSIFPGNIDEHLITNNSDAYIATKGNYERVPMFIGNQLDGQYLGQWIYFRQNNPYSKANIYRNDLKQNAYDYRTELQNQTTNDKLLIYKDDFTNYINDDNNQVLLGFRNNRYISGFDYTKIEANMSDDSLDALISNGEVTGIDTLLSNFNTYIYDNYNILGGEDTQHIKTIGGNVINTYIAKYENFVITRSSGTYQYLDDKTSLSGVIRNIYRSNTSDSSATAVSNTDDLIGGFLFPNLLSKSQILTDGGNTSAKYIDVGGSISIPIVFEYYVESSQPTITKSMYFDLRNSLITDPLHYMLEVTGNYDYTTTGEIYKNIDEVLN